jgi:NDP-mannose synthase
MRAIVLAGGKGTRLLPYTTIVPKPLLPIGDQSIIEILIRQLCHGGFDRITIALGHLAHLFQAYLGNGNRFGVEIDYRIEDKPLGTSGPLGTLEGLPETFMVLNGDVLTDLDFRDLVRTHKQNCSAFTVASHRRTVSIDYGVIHREENRLVRYEEKPVIHYEVSMGVYVVEPLVLRYIAPSEYQDIPDLIKLLLKSGEKVCSHPYDGIWFDLGRAEDFQEVHGSLEVLSQKIPFFSASSNGS